MPRYLISACALGVLLVLASCSQPVGGTPDEPRYADNVIVVDTAMDANTVWSSDHVYYLSDIVRVQNGATLTIEAGTVVKFASAAELHIESTAHIQAAGTAASPIIFTSPRDSNAGGDSVLDDGAAGPSAGDWLGIIVDDGSSGNAFRHCVFRFGGRNKTAPLKLAGAATVDSCFFYDNVGGHPLDSDAVDSATLDASEADEGTVITNNTFYRNLWPLGIAAPQSQDSSNAFSYVDGDPATRDDNTHQAVFLNYGDIAGSVSWQETDVPLCFFGYLVRVTETGRLSIASGAVVKNLDSDFQFLYGSTVTRTGVIFTSYHDDSRMGDTDADGSTVAPQDGDWVGIEIEDSEGAFSYLPNDPADGIYYSGRPL